ncbi:MAG: excinuclease ABC subunit UvrC, partial [Lachnospiraceae bacterium]|nr:excinuclease ABC subunit UvrC [Lachnospiraceae bacterium]
QTKSVLDEIPGVGPARRKALMRTFASINDIKGASVEDLLRIPEINPQAAESIYTFFHNKE